jgi:hypothetical protein
MKKLIKTVTVTGADDSNNVADLVEIQKRFPFVEWGILVSGSSQGGNRFPTEEWMRGLLPHKDELTLSGHICGKWVRDLCKGENSLYVDMPFFDGLFSRYQLNFHAYHHRIEDNESFVSTIASLHASQIIFQFDDVNNGLLTSALYGGVDAVPLFDTSGGAGVLPQEWPEATSWYTGYAGGLSPENLAEQMELILEKCGEGPIWIDAETWLRSDGDQTFDLDKVVAFLEAATPFLIES